MCDGNLVEILEKRRRARGKRRTWTDKRENENECGGGGGKKKIVDKIEIIQMSIPVKMLEQIIKYIISEILAKKLRTTKQQHEWHSLFRFRKGYQMNNRCKRQYIVIPDVLGFDSSDVPLDSFHSHKMSRSREVLALVSWSLDLALVRPLLESRSPSWLSPDENTNGRVELVLSRVTGVTGPMGPRHQERG